MTATDEPSSISARRAPPPSGGEDVAQEQGVLVGDGVGDARERIVREGDAHELRLASVDAAAELPTAVLAVVHPTALAEEARAAERLAIHCHAIAGRETGDVRANFLHHAHELVPQHRVGQRARHRAAHDVQIARADGRARHAHDGVGGKLQRGSGRSSSAMLPLPSCTSAFMGILSHGGFVHGSTGPGGAGFCNRAWWRSYS